MTLSASGTQSGNETELSRPDDAESGKLATLPTMKKNETEGVSVSTFREALPESRTISARHEPRFSCSLRVAITGLTWDCIFTDEEFI